MGERTVLPICIHLFPLPVSSSRLGAGGEGVRGKGASFGELAYVILIWLLVPSVEVAIDQILFHGTCLCTNYRGLSLSCQTPHGDPHTAFIVPFISKALSE